MRIVLYISLCVFLVHGLIYSSTEKYIVNAYRLNIRTCASTECEVLGYLSKSDTLHVESIDGNWGKVVLKDGTTGYALVRYLTKVSSINNTNETKDESSEIERINWLKLAPLDWLKYSIIPFLLAIIGIVIVGYRKLVKDN